MVFKRIIIGILGWTNPTHLALALGDAGPVALGDLPQANPDLTGPDLSVTLVGVNQFKERQLKEPLYSFYHRAAKELA